MSAQYDRIDQQNEDNASFMQRFIDSLNVRRVDTIVNYSNDNRSDDAASIYSTGSTYSETFELKKEIWRKKKIILIITGTVIICVIFVIALLILEPWK